MSTPILISSRSFPVLALALASLLSACGPGPGAKTDAGTSGLDESLGAPTRLTGVADVAKVHLTWQPPKENADLIVGYDITILPAGTAVQTEGVESSFTVEGLENGTAYTFTVAARSDRGTGRASSPSPVLKTPNIPGEPRGVSAVGGVGTVVVSWLAPPNNGSPITGYTVTANPGGATVTVDGATTTATFNGLTAGVFYSFVVTATNVVGPSAPSPDAASAITHSVPTPPTRVSALRGDGQLTVKWFPPSSDGGAPITGYKVTASPGGATATAEVGSTSAVVTGLTNGTAYTFVVTAVNAAGESAPSDPSAPIDPATVPGAPTAVSANSTIRREATISWTAPATTGGIPLSGYRITSIPGGFGLTVGPTESSAVVNGLINGTSYTFTVSALNEVGAGPASAPSNSVITYDVPEAPTGVVAVRGNASADVTWIASANDGGTAIASYVVTASPGGAQAVVAPPATAATVAGLTNGTNYTFTVRAVNSAGNSPASLPSNGVVPATVPAAPVSVTAIAGVRQATVNWTAANNGGATLIRYRVTPNPQPNPANPIELLVGGNTTTATVEGLANGTAYTFSVFAENEVGAGPAKSSTAITTHNVPSAPTLGAVTRGNGKVNVKWTLSTSNGNSPVLNYIVTANPGGLTTTSVSGTSTSVDVTNLSNGIPYTFTVHAKNAVGDSPPSAVSDPPVVFGTSPNVVTNVVATAGIREAVVTWTAPTDNGGYPITSYTVTSSPHAKTATLDCTTPCTTLTATVPGLSNNTAYTFTVRATNEIGQSPISATSASVTTPATPSTPTGVTATAADGQATVNWTASTADAAHPITGYTVTTFVGTGSTQFGTAVTVAATATTANVTGLNNGTAYSFRVKATNDVGDSSNSTASSTVTPATVPGAPTNVAGQRGVRSSVVTWTAPASNGGSAITNYFVTVTPAPPVDPATKMVGNVTTTTFNNLADDTVYTFSVRAKNAIGEGAESALSDAVSTYGVSDAPEPVTATGGNAQATVVWTVPGNTGGRPITGFKVSSTPATTTKSVSGATATTTTMTGLTNGTSYTFTVVAVTAVGDGVPATSNAVVPATVPGPVTGLVAAQNAGAIDVSWTAPASNGGSALTGYTVTANPGNVTQNVGASVTGASLAGLPAGVQYTVTVVAKNALGSSAVATASSALTCTVPGFAAEQLQTPGGTPQGIASGDFNKDGKLDVAVANAANDKVNVFLGTGNGTFGAPVDVTVGDGPTALIAASVNTDTHLDLVVVNELAGTVQVLLGSANGTFTAQTAIATGAAPSSLTFADFSGDGTGDLVVAHKTANTVSFLRGNGNGTFQTKVDTTFTVGVNFVTYGQLTADTNRDLVVSLADDQIAVLKGNGNGTFQAPTFVAASGAPQGIVIGRFDAGANEDLVVVNATGGVLSVYFGQGDGTFLAPVNHTLAAAGILSVISADFDLDGALDVAVTGASYINTVFAVGSSTPLIQNTATTAETYGIVAGDFDADGRLDVVTTSDVAGTVSSRLGTCSP